MSWWRTRWWWWLVAAALPVWLLLAWWRPPHWQWPGPAWLTMVLLYPVLEELAFRGGLQQWLWSRPLWRRDWCGISAANGVTALVFALAHVPLQGPAWAAAVVLPGLAFGYCWERGGLRPAIALHIWYNAGFFTLYPPGV